MVAISLVGSHCEVNEVVRGMENTNNQTSSKSPSFTDKQDFATCEYPTGDTEQTFLESSLCMLCTVAGFAWKKIVCVLCALIAMIYCLNKFHNKLLATPSGQDVAGDDATMD